MWAHFLDKKCAHLIFIVKWTYQVDMAKLVNAHDSGSCEEILGGSSPPIDILFF